MSQFILVLTTTESVESARKIAKELVERKLAACVNIIPGVESVYRWNDAVETSQEFLLIVKTTDQRFQAVRDAVRELHTYDVPECLEIKVDNGSEPYLQWIAQSVASDTV